MSDFGDFDEHDAFDASGVVDGDQLLVKLRRLHDLLGDDHDEVGRRLVAWLRRQGGAR